MKRLHTSLAIAVLMAGLTGGAQAQARSTYIVQLADEPAATYSGTVAGYRPTITTPGRTFNGASPSVRAYRGYLDARQTSVAATVGAQTIHRYSVVFNGFAARLTPAEVAQLRANPLVVDVQADEARQMDTISTPAFLGLSTPGGVWSQTRDGIPIKGEGIVIGIVDSGISPENPAYADRVDAAGNPVFTGGTLAYTSLPPSWAGSCAAGAGFDPAKHCNNKLIGAQAFNAGLFAAGQTLHALEYDSPRDAVGTTVGRGGHGTHTSSTAGGNANNSAAISGISLGAAAGIAPRARIAAYKVCWTFNDPSATDGTGSRNACYSSDSVAAIDKAVADGVNVINYSISGSRTSVNDPVEQAFLRAAQAGVFVATSGGNSGPTSSPRGFVAHVSPWLTTVAASTHDRYFEATVTLGSNGTAKGPSYQRDGLPTKPLVLAKDIGKVPYATLSNAQKQALERCYLPGDGASADATIDPAKAAGKIVVCYRGGNVLINKAAVVQGAGGAGLIIQNTPAIPESGAPASATTQILQTYVIPTVHLATAAFAAVVAEATSATGTAAFSGGVLLSVPAPVMAGFSSRGPNQGDSNMLKPDLTAPGVDIIAGYSPSLTQAQHDAVAAGTLAPPASFASIQGTSMASPHVAGLAALIKQAQPTWSPAAIKSALMTTATTTLNDNVAGLDNGLLPWAQGAGHVTPLKAVDPGLVYDAGKIDFIRYQCKVNKAAVVPASDCTTFGALDETYNYNLPSITVGSVVGSVTVTRRVRNVGTASASYSSTAAVPGFTATVTPATLTLAPGETQSFTVTLTKTSAAENVWNYGSLTWTDGVHVVRSPMTVRAGKTIVAPAVVTGDTTSGTRLMTVQTGFAGRMTANRGGLKNVTMGPTTSLTPNDSLDTAAVRTACIAGGNASVAAYPVTVPAGTIVARFALRNADVGAAGDDFDLFLLGPTNATIATSLNAESNESVEVASPPAGTYRVCVHAYGAAGGAPTMTHKLSSWVVTNLDNPGNFRVMLPGMVYSGGQATVGLSWYGLGAGGRYVGGVEFVDNTPKVATTTVIRVDTPAPPPVAGLPR